MSFAAEKHQHVLWCICCRGKRFSVSNNTIVDKHFNDLVDWLKPGDVLVLNNTKVIPARFYGEKKSGGRIEGLIERIIEPHQALAHLKASKAPKPGSFLVLEGGYSAKVLSRNDGIFENRKN